MLNSLNYFVQFGNLKKEYYKNKYNDLKMYYIYTYIFLF